MPFPGDRDSRTIAIMYTGEWPSGQWVTIDLPAREAREEWDKIRGDFDVESLLERHGYDAATNERRRST